MDKKRRLTSFGIACKKAMLEKEMSQTELARRVGSSTKYLDLVFHGERTGKKYISAIIKELGIDPDSIDKSIA
ncbi:transcriptional regulator with XRE-family HTH domain [Clostridium acetobutylicum]|uniref:CRO repressor-like DNA-binding protein n=1 Tax=Clostridium acetobutylicum (strain ATCC 824 / DSM 792 / JCM 1419 / IAM 19013 / LMG 5710 / NBRC 13948 / NRRL B-527 / VKM B-1787 / 2291 / W) TaxID=272562 RepID=Q97D41_CLOAB|nr:MULTISPECIES: helix-turn-helix transcriptional regulator [Clostridium]AAK81562.1 CRO repressor-like DNA-binding protein [Clostridium acetobutylicum ATCC 824]ADZ22683.1 CRO repressor-like DNA-binding protein [Clostridium acetobutylicum EA 2018]AEI32965.1 CRO repressor-like DNA-binding protein [Clostridium acetobutylicum DSM 1731]AWV80765.1 XRE family transcriptional regulator [Clostridium acetobutylicum]KHD35490.1 Cro/Cl family transcriptional regulator [Clostridium acetobutylicum]